MTEGIKGQVSFDFNHLNEAHFITENLEVSISDLIMIILNITVLIIIIIIFAIKAFKDKQE